MAFIPKDIRSIQDTTANLTANLLDGQRGISTNDGQWIWQNDGTVFRSGLATVNYDLDGFNIVIDQDNDSFWLGDRDAGVNDDELHLVLGIATRVKFSASEVALQSGTNLSIGIDNALAQLHISDGGTAHPSFSPGTVAIFQNNFLSADNVIVDFIAGLTGACNLTFSESVGQTNFGEINVNVDRLYLASAGAPNFVMGSDRVLMGSDASSFIGSGDLTAFLTNTGTVGITNNSTAKPPAQPSGSGGSDFVIYGKAGMSIIVDNPDGTTQITMGRGDDSAGPEDNAAAGILKYLHDGTNLLDDRWEMIVGGLTTAKVIYEQDTNVRRLSVVGASGQGAPTLYSAATLFAVDNSGSEGDVAISIVAGEGDGAGRSILNFAFDTNEFVTRIIYDHNDDDLIFIVDSVEAFRVDGSQRFLIGATAFLGSTCKQYVAHDDSTTCGVGLEAFGASGNGASVVFNKSRNGSAGGHTIINNGDLIGALEFRGSDGADFEDGAAIRVKAVSPASNSMTTEMEFHVRRTTTALFKTMLLKRDAVGSSLTLEDNQGGGFLASLNLSSVSAAAGNFIGRIAFVNQGTGTTGATICARPTDSGALDKMRVNIEVRDSALTQAISIWHDTRVLIGQGTSQPDGALEIEPNAGGTDKGYITMGEITPPGNAPTDKARLFVDLNGVKTRLQVIFQSGAVQQIAIEP